MNDTTTTNQAPDQPPAAPTLPALVAQAAHDGPIWHATSEQLNLNLLRFRRGDGIPPHRNGELDVAIIVIAGEGLITIDGERQRLSPGSVVVIPRGAERALEAVSEQFAYLSCHQRRGALQPSMPAPAERA